MLYYDSYLFLIFFIYSVVGYVIEILFCTYHSHKLVLNRGFLIGPYLPIYGSSVLLMYLCLNKYQKDPFALFIMSMFICSVMEFFTSYILEKIFKIRWWDYSDQKLNLDGRICLSNSILFGLGGVVIFYFLNPIFLSVLDSLSSTILIVVALLCASLFAIDLIISVMVLIQLKVSSIHFSSKDMTTEVIALRNEQLRKNSLLFNRLLNAFPRFEGRNKELLVDLKRRVHDIRHKIKKQKKDAK